MKKIITIFVFISFIAAAMLSLDVFAQDEAAEAAREQPAGKIINTACPIMGDDVDNNTPYKLEYEGKTIGFCCPDCIKKFKNEPEKYMDKIEKKKEKISGACPM